MYLSFINKHAFRLSQEKSTTCTAPSIEPCQRFNCTIVHIEALSHEFFIQDDQEVATKIAELVRREESTASTFSIDEIKQLSSNTIVIAMFDGEPFRATIESEKSDEYVNVYYVDFGNVDTHSKKLLKRCSEQLSAYPYQCKRCRLYGIPSTEIDRAFTYLEDNIDSENMKISIVNKEDCLYNVLLYNGNKCVNEQFGYNPNLIEEQEPLSVTEKQEPSSVSEKQEPSSVIEERELSSVSEKQEPSSVTEKQEPSSVIEEQEPSSVTEKQEPSSVTEKQEPSSVTEKQEPSSVTEKQEPSSVTEKQEPSSVIEKQEPSSVTEKQEPSSVIEEQEPSSVSEKQEPSSVIEEQEPSSVTEKQEPSSVIEEQEPSSVSEKQEPSSVTEKTRTIISN